MTIRPLNHAGCSKKVSARVPDGLLKWMTSVLRMTDDELLPWVGLDGFIYLQTIKLMIGLLVVLALPSLFILAPVYYVGSSTDSNAQFFIQISAMGAARNRVYWFTLLFNYFMAVTIFYGLYIFYKNLSIYRQAFLHNPASCVSQVSMRKLAKTIGSMGSARKLINVSSRSIIVTNVSSKYSKQELIDMFTAMGLDDIVNILIVQNRSKVRKMLEKRNCTMMKLEDDLRVFYGEMLKYVAAAKGMTTSEVEREHQDRERFIATERSTMMNRLVHDTSILPTIRPTRMETGDSVDVLSTRYGELIRRDDELLEAANRFAADNERYILTMADSSSSAEPANDAVSEASTDLLISGKAIVSWEQFMELKRNTKDYGLTLWGTSMSVIVVFGSQRSASVGQQTLLSYRPFSMETLPAPTADDIIWDNLYFPAADRFVRSLAVDVLYAVVNILFTSVNLAITPMLSVGTFEKEVPALADLLNKYPKLRGVLSGILAPLFYNLFLLLAPYMLYGLAIFQGTISKTRVQESLMQKFTWFLFIQSFVMFLFSSALVVVIEKVLTGQYNEIISRLQSYLPDYAAFFTNVILQRAAISLMTALINPGALFLLFINSVFFGNNLRRRAMATEPNKVFIGALYPEYLVLVFIIATAFLPLTPIISLAGIAFYSIAYLVFRYHFIFTYEVPHESGGRYWMFLPTPLMVGCLVAQIFSIIQFSFSDGVVQALCMAPLMIITLGGIVFIRGVFNRRASYQALSMEAADRMQQLSERMCAKQAEMVKEIALEAGEDTSFLQEDVEPVLSPEDSNGWPRAERLLGLRNYETVPYDFGDARGRRLLMDAQEGGALGSMSAQENPYSNPIMFKRYPLIIVPACFFHVLQDALAIEHGKSGAAPPNTKPIASQVTTMPSDGNNSTGEASPHKAAL